VIGGERPLRKLFSKEQRAFYAANAPADIDLDSLIPLGPTFILKGTFTPREMGRRFTAEYWLYQDGSRVLELSTKCTPAETFQVAAEARAYLISRGIKLGGGQSSKTRTALEFFKAQLDAAAKSAKPAARKPAARKPAARKPAAPRKTTKPAAARRTTKSA
ncbi:MAG TPA: hypothetical protein VEX62_13885, partial [Candidatus Limnocylindrales bacterium]|nr:hypothetical protein [Candidatus Limnocylindrales bacterium]